MDPLRKIRVAAVLLGAILLPAPALAQSLADSLIRAAEQLKRRIPELTDAQITVELQRLLAMVGQNHNKITDLHALPARFAPAGQLPVVMVLRADGVLITDATEQFQSLLGARVLAIDGTSIKRVLEKLRPLYPTEAGFRAEAPTFLGRPYILQAAGVAQRLDRVRLTVATRAGRSRTVELPVVTRPEYRSLGAGATPPLARSRPGEANWFEHLPEHGAVYVNFSRGVDAQGETIAAFGQRLRQFLRGHEQVKNLVLDLRTLSGGDTYRNSELVRTLIWFDAQEGTRSYVLIGRYTASAGMNPAVQLDRLTDAVFVGEPTGQPIEVEDGIRLVLPYSGLRFMISSAVWNLSSPRDLRRWIAPDVPVAETIETSTANRDPVMEAVLELIRQRPGS